MYVLAVIEDKLTTIPEFFERQRSEVLIEQIEVKYSNKVILDVGLCICFYDFLQVGDAYIYPSEGSAIQEVKFRVVIFRPFIGELIVGKIVESTADGLRVSLNFFDDVHIPPTMMQDPSVFIPSTNRRLDQKQGMWVWKYGTESENGVDGTSNGNEGEVENRFVMEVGDEVRFKVRMVNFATAAEVVASATATQKLEPPGKVGKTTTTSSTAISAITEVVVPPKAVMQVLGCTNDFGLGLLSWW